MTAEEEKEVKEGLTHKRDNLQHIMNDARKQRAELRLQNREKYADFLQKLGELSFAFGAAIIPVIIVSNSKGKITHLLYVLIGIAVYLLNGLVAMWKTKSKIEQDADDAPFIGLDEEIDAYPVINAINKLLHELGNKKYQQEYKDATNVETWDASKDKEDRNARTSFLLDILVLNFVIASLLVARTVWTYSSVLYWAIFIAIVAVLLSLIVLSYIRTIKSQYSLRAKHEKLRGIRSDYQKWFDEEVMKR